MEKYKVCPVCGAHNNPQFLECSNCEADLQNVPVTDAEMEQRLQAPDEKSKEGILKTNTMVRICDCGAKNPVQARQCVSCGENISMIVPTPDQATTETHFVLSSLDGSYAFELHEGITVIGRENTMHEFLADKSYVSRRHAELILYGDNLKIKNCNATNHTFVNNIMLSENECMDLKNGDEIGLGGNMQSGSRQSEAAYFLVRIESCM